MKPDSPDELSMNAKASSFPDHFSGVAGGYASYRPRYAPALFAALAEVAPATDVVWDCACGTGQASVGLAKHFARVVATDASAEQIAHAEAHSGVEYRVAAAEDSGLADESVSLVTVAQALHWFDVDAFHREVQRVLRPGGVIAEWSYALLEVPDAPAVADAVDALDAQLRDWWPPQRRHVDARYTTLAFPFTPIELGSFDMTAAWSAAALIGYVSTWSAVSRYRAANDDDPIPAFAAAVERAWGRAPTHAVYWPLTLRAGRMPA